MPYTVKLVNYEFDISNPYILSVFYCLPDFLRFAIDFKINDEYDTPIQISGSDKKSATKFSI